MLEHTNWAAKEKEKKRKEGKIPSAARSLLAGIAGRDLPAQLSVSQSIA